MGLNIGWEEQGNEAVARLQQLIRFDTTNPPGNELPLVRHLASFLQDEGLQPRARIHQLKNKLAHLSNLLATTSVLSRKGRGCSTTSPSIHMASANSCPFANSS